MRALWNGTVIADSDSTLVVEGNHYFPPTDVVSQHLRPSEHTSVCAWKGEASYFDVVVDGQETPNAAWVYRSPKEAAQEITNHVAFWRGVRVE